MDRADPAPADDQAALLLCVGRGDEHALRLLINRWQKPLFHFFYRAVPDAMLAEDLTQMTFIRLYKAAPRYRAEAPFTAFLFQIARRLLLNEYRRQHRKPADAVDPADLHHHAQEDNPRRIAEWEELFSRALDTLSEEQRTALLLLKQQELSYDEIAATMETSLANVKSWIFRARQKIKKQLEDPS